MENAALMTILKWLFPSLIGAILAVYYKAKELNWRTLPKVEIIYLILLGFGMCIISVILSFYIGGSVIDYFKIPHDTKYAALIHFIFGFSGIKITDALAKNLDGWINKIVEVITKVLDKFLGRFL